MHLLECRLRTRACFECGQQGYKAMDCPNKKVGIDKGGNLVGNKAKMNARVHAMTDLEAEASGNVVTGMLLINSVPVFMLFDCSASYSFIAKKFAKHLCTQPK